MFQAQYPLGVYQDPHGYVSIVYGRTRDGNLRILTKSQGIRKCMEVSVARFGRFMKQAMADGKAYPMNRAADVWLKSQMPMTDRCVRVLRNLRDSQPVDNVPLEEILDMTPSAKTEAQAGAGRRRVRRQGRSSEERRRARKAARAARLAKMTPKEIAAMRKAKKERRAELRKLRSKS